MIHELVDTTLSHYRLRQLLARGGMSIVYIAEDTRTDCIVAIKLVHKSNHEYYRHFQREVRTLTTLTHKHVLPVIESGEHGSWFYMVMPYIAYGTLKQHLTKGALSTQEAGNILAQLADALHMAHGRGIAHGDIKPSNILLRNGEHAYLADFGLARHIQETEDTVQIHALQGTPEYMAPELTTQSPSPSADIYALGIVLYQMLTGHLPFKSSTPIGLYWKHLREQPVAPSFHNPMLSHATDKVVLRALAKNPGQRFSTTRKFADAYQASLRNRVVPLYKIHAGTPAIAAVMLLCILPSLLGFSFSYLTSHAQAPTRVNLSESRVHIDTAQPVSPHRIPDSTTTPPLLHASTKVLMSQLVVKPATHSTSNDEDKDDKAKHKHAPQDILDVLAV